MNLSILAQNIEVQLLLTEIPMYYQKYVLQMFLYQSQLQLLQVLC